MQEEKSSASEDVISSTQEPVVKACLDILNSPTASTTTDVEELDSVIDVSGKSLELTLFEGGDAAATSSSDCTEGLCVYKNVFYLMPRSLGNFKGRLKTLKFFANEINLFPPEFRDLVELEQLQVKVSMPGLTGIPLHKLESLKELELAKVPPRPSAFPILNQIAELKRLTKLSVCHFSIRYLPPEIGCLDSLECLDLSFNKMRSLPNEISSLSALVSLKVANNKLVEIPASLSSLEKLENIDLSRNRLASLGSLDLNLMRNLRNLNLQYNKLLSCEIPAWICCNLEGNCGDLFSEELVNSAVEMDLYETAVEDDQNLSSNVSSGASSSHLAGCSSNGRCSPRRNLGKRWKRKQYLQQRARQERLSHSRKWKVEEHDDVLSIQSAGNCKMCKKPNLVSESPVECASGCACNHRDCKQSFFGEANGVVLPETAEIDDIGSKGPELETCCCIDREVLKLDDCEESSASLPCGVADQIEGPSNQVLKPNPKSKRHSDRVLDNPKPRKSLRSTDEQPDVSRRYSAISFCGTEDHLPDGFYDAGRDRPFMSLRSYEHMLDLDSREVILIDREVDEELDAITLSAQALVFRLKQLCCSRQQSDQVADDNLLAASLLALFVSDHFGGSDRSCLLERVRKDVSGSNYCKPFVCSCSTGTSEKIITKPTFDTMDIVFRDMCEKSIRAIKARHNSIVVPIGTLQFGVCRHRAVLMKYLCDRMEPPLPCELIRGYLDFSPHAWNAIPIKRGGSWVRMIIDACRPHDIREERDPEYFCRYIPLTRITAPITSRIEAASPCSFPSFSTSDEVEKAASSSLMQCKVGDVEAVAKVRTLEVSGSAGDKVREFEYRCVGEVRILGAVMGHACIVNIYGHQISSEWIPASDARPEHRVLRSAILMEYVKGGSLKNYLKKLSEANEKRVPIGLTLTIARDVACALKELHSKHIIHRDLKSENILLDMKGQSNDGSPVVKLCDFDQAVPLRCFLHSCCVAHVGIHPPDVCVGTPRWMAPEVLRAMHEHNAYGLEVDIWSYGCLLLELLTLQVPYSGLPESNIHDHLQSGKRPLLSDELELLSLSDSSSASKNLELTDAELDALRFLVDIFHQCTEGNPADRPAAENLYELLQAKSSSFKSKE